MWVQLRGGETQRQFHGMVRSQMLRLMGHFWPDSGRCRLTVPRDGFLGHSRVRQKTCPELLWAGSVANFQAVPKTVVF